MLGNDKYIYPLRLGITPKGKINITNTSETDVSAYATAQVVDANLLSHNIANGVTILEITGSFTNEDNIYGTLLTETFGGSV